MTKILGLSVALFGLALLACAQPAAAPSGQPSGAAQPKSGGILNTYGQDFTDFDMGGPQGRSSPNVEDHSLVYDGLLALKMGPGADYVSQILELQLAEKWEVAPDARTFTYTLRKGAKFADIAPVNGRELNSGDVKWSLEYYSRTGEFADSKLPPSQIRELFEGMEGIDVPDKHTVKIRFKEAYAPFLNYSASQWMPIAAKETFKDNKIATLVGTGPYIYDLENTQKDARFVFKKNPTYWGGPQKPYLDSIRRLIIPDISTRMAAFQAKQLDILSAADFASAQQIKLANPDAVPYESLSHGHRMMMTSQKRGGALTDLRVRKALSLALDLDEFNKVLDGGKGGWALGGSWPGLFTDAEAHSMLKYDPEQSKKLLAEAGFGNGLKLEILPSGEVGTVEQLVQAQLKRVGVETVFVVLPREQNRAKLFPGDFDLFVGSNVTLGDSDFDAFLFSYHSSSAQNWSQIKDPELDKLVVAQRREGDPTKRREAQRAVVKYINANTWINGLGFPVVRIYTQPYVKNYAPLWTAGEEDAFVWLDK